MAVGKDVRGALWIDGQFTIKVRSPGAESGRTFRVRRPFALIGRIQGADLRIDDSTVNDRHTFLLMDQRGILGVDLVTQTGTRFAGADTAWSWLGTGDILEVAGHRVEILQLKANATTINPPLSNDDPFGPATEARLASLTLEPLDHSGQPWQLGSTLAFMGSGDACAIRIDNPSASSVHCALLRDQTGAYLIDLIGQRTLCNGQAIQGATRLLNGDRVTIGSERFIVHIEQNTLAHPNERETQRSSTSTSHDIVLHRPVEQASLVARLVESSPEENLSASVILDALRQFQSDAATLLEAQLERIDMLQREIASLRQEVRNAPSGPRPAPRPKAPPLRLDLMPPAPPPPSEASNPASATWLLDRINSLETETRSTWKDLLGRITTSIQPRPQPDPTPSLAQIGTELSSDDLSGKPPKIDFKPSANRDHRNTDRTPGDRS